MYSLLGVNIAIIKMVIKMILWKEEKIVSPEISHVLQEKPNFLEIFLVLPVSKKYIYLYLNPKKQTFFTTREDITHNDHKIIDLINYFIFEVDKTKKTLGNKLDKEEDMIEGAVSKSELENLLSISRDCHYLKESLHNLTSIINYVEAKSDYLQDYESLNLNIKISHLSYELDNIQAQVLTLTEVSDLLYTQGQNTHIKRLTIFALIFSVPTFITSFYGMNINLPFQSHPSLLLILVGANAVITLIILLIIKHFG